MRKNNICIVWYAIYTHCKGGGRPRDSHFLLLPSRCFGRFQTINYLRARTACMLPDNNVGTGWGTYTAFFLIGVNFAPSNPPLPEQSVVQSQSSQKHKRAASSAGPASHLHPTSTHTYASLVDPVGAGPSPTTHTPDTRPFSLSYPPFTTPAGTGATIPAIPVSHGIGMSYAPHNALFNLSSGSPPMAVAQTLQRDLGSRGREIGFWSGSGTFSKSINPGNSFLSSHLPSLDVPRAYKMSLSWSVSEFPGRYGCRTTLRSVSESGSGG